MADFIILHEETASTNFVTEHIIQISSIDDICPGKKHDSVLPIDKDNITKAIAENAFTDEGAKVLLRGGSTLFVYESIKYIQTKLCSLGNRIV